MRVWYELRVRELISPNHWVKKSKFYEVNSASGAVRIYKKRVKVPHTIMWCEKDKRHRPERLADQASGLYAEICRERARVRAPSLGNTFKDFLSIPGMLLGELAEPVSEKEVRSKRIIKRRSYGNREKAAY